MLVIAHLVCKICLYLIENFKSSLSLIKVAWKNKREIEKAEVEGGGKKPEEIQGTAKSC